MAAVIWTGSSGNHLVLEASDGLFSLSYDPLKGLATFQHALHKQSWMLTIALGGNTLTGDAIVWWRACTIWQHKVVNCTGLLLLTSTLICGIVGMLKSRGIPGLAFLIQGNVYAQIAALLSLSTNVLATSLIAYKAWEHRQLMKRHFAGGRTPSRVFKALALLTESGCIYCALLIFVIVYQANSTTSEAPSRPFVIVAAHFTYGCFLPLVAIYPTIIIVLVALKRSPIDTSGLSQVRRQARYGHDSETADVRTFSTIVFHHSTFRTSASVEMEGATVEASPADGERWGRHPLEMPMCEGGVKVVGNIA